jgi:pyroglutamyl-peptidase
MIGIMSTAFAYPEGDTHGPQEEIILLTGFEPFGSNTINVSWEVVRQFDNTVLFNRYRIVALQLPVLWNDADDILITSIDQYSPVLVISTGQGNNSITLERIADNRNLMLADNLGELPVSEIISMNAPAFYVTSFDIEHIQTAIASLGITTEISDNAGNYLCNFVSFHAYDYLAAHFPQSRALFVHLPTVWSDTGSVLPEQEAVINGLVDVLNIVILDALEQTSAEI